MTECIKDASHQFPLWIAAQKIKSDDHGAPYGRVDFDKMLGAYDAVSDLPTVLFADELIAAYPEAKVLLTVREAEDRVVSMQRTIYLDHS